MRSITVDPEQLESCAARIDDRNQDYQKSYTQLFESVEGMQTSWTGKDNIAFTNQIEEFQADFKEMSVLCTQYAEFLKTSANSYRQIQNDLAAQAISLGK